MNFICIFILYIIRVNCAYKDLPDDLKIQEGESYCTSCSKKIRQNINTNNYQDSEVPVDISSSSTSKNDQQPNDVKKCDDTKISVIKSSSCASKIDQQQSDVKKCEDTGGSTNISRSFAFKREQLPKNAIKRGDTELLAGGLSSFCYSKNEQLSNCTKKYQEADVKSTSSNNIAFEDEQEQDNMPKFHDIGVQANVINDSSHKNDELFDIDLKNSKGLLENVSVQSKTEHTNETQTKNNHFCSHNKPENEKNLTLTKLQSSAISMKNYFKKGNSCRKEKLDKNTEDKNIFKRSINSVNKAIGKINSQKNKNSFTPASFEDNVTREGENNNDVKMTPRSTRFKVSLNRVMNNTSKNVSTGFRYTRNKIVGSKDNKSDLESNKFYKELLVPKIDNMIEGNQSTSSKILDHDVKPSNLESLQVEIQNKTEETDLDNGINENRPSITTPDITGVNLKDNIKPLEVKYQRQHALKEIVSNEDKNPSYNSPPPITKDNEKESLSKTQDNKPVTQPLKYLGAIPKKLKSPKKNNTELDDMKFKLCNSCTLRYLEINPENKDCLLCCQAGVLGIISKKIEQIFYEFDNSQPVKNGNKNDQENMFKYDDDTIKVLYFENTAHYNAVDDDVNLSLHASLKPCDDHSSQYDELESANYKVNNNSDRFKLSLVDEIDIYIKYDQGDEFSSDLEKKSMCKPNENEIISRNNTNKIKDLKANIDEICEDDNLMLKYETKLSSTFDEISGKRMHRGPNYNCEDD